MNKKILMTAGLLVAGLALGLRLAFFTVSIRNAPVNTDEAIEFLMAKHIAHGQPHWLVMSQPYRFPLESYCTAPFVRWLPRTEFGARIIPFVLGLLDVLLLLLILRQCVKFKADEPDEPVADAAPARPPTSWPAALWILLPSAYLLMQQTGYRITGYTAMTTCSLLAILAALNNQRLARVFACGLAGGLAFSSTMLALPVILATGIYSVLAGQLRRLPARLTVYLPGLALGLLPFWISGRLAPGAHGKVTETTSMAEGLKNLSGKTFRQAMASALGIEPNIFPDETPLRIVPGLDVIVVYIWAAAVCALLAVRLWQVARDLARRHRLTLTPWDIFLGLTILNVAAAVTSRRFDARSVRYLLPAVWCFPFIITSLATQLSRTMGHAWAWRRRVIRGLTAGFLILLAGFNVYATILLMREWRAPDFATRVIKTPDLRPALEFLEARGIRHCVASHWVAYRINFITDEAILCSQPQNERFPDWPLPYKDQVDHADNVAYVLTDHVRFLKPAIFERHLRTMNVTARREALGEFMVYHDFQSALPAGHASALPAADIQASASHGQDDAHKLLDGNHQTRWTTRASQTPGMWVQLDFPAFYNINRITLHYGRYHLDSARGLNVLARTTNGWETIAANLPADLDKFDFRNGHPVYGESPQQTLTGIAVRANAVRLEISEPCPYRNWTITQLEVGVTD